ncbi:MAG: hypothetical protein PF517_13515 [Salinivirgaceae bacterium]|jgi:hypothetical protein|nr:hypothetical protein [Salinivirgaceae bacterium]
MNKLIIIIITSILILHACFIEPEPEEPNIRFTIDNSSSFGTEITIFNAGIPEQSLSEDITISIPSKEGYSYFYLLSDKYLLIEPADSAFIKFNDERIIKYIRNDNQIRNFLDTAYWEISYSPATGYIYRYTITEEDFEHALEID